MTAAGRCPDDHDRLVPVPNRSDRRATPAGRTGHSHLTRSPAALGADVAAQLTVASHNGLVSRRARAHAVLARRSSSHARAVAQAELDACDAELARRAPAAAAGTRLGWTNRATTWLVYDDATGQLLGTVQTSPTGWTPYLLDGDRVSPALPTAGDAAATLLAVAR